MSSTGTRKPRDVQSRATESIIESDKELINGFKIFAESSNSTAGLAGPAVNNSPKTPAGNYLAREGDSMIGPLALGPPLDFRIEVDSDNTIDIGPLNENAQYTSNVQLDDFQPNSSVLDIIANAAFDGQILILRTFAPTVPYTISQATLGNGGNIQTGDGSDLTVGDLETILLIFDESLVVHANTGGTWRVLSVSSGGSGGENQTPWLSDIDGANFALNNVSSIQITDTVGGVHGLLQGLAATGIRLTLTAGEQFNIFDNITNIFQMDSTTGLQIFGNNFVIGTGGNIVAGGAGEGLTNTGHIDFIDNLATPAAAISLYSDGTDLFANTGGGVVNLSNIVPQTPWLSNINADGFSLNNLLAIDIEDSAGDTKLGISGPLGVGARFSFVSGDTVFFTENITDILSITASGLNLLTHNIVMGTGGNIVAGGSGEGLTNTGHIDFVDNLATPAAAISLYSDGTDLFANTGGGVKNLSDIGGEFFGPWTATHDAGNESLTNLASVTITDTSGNSHGLLQGILSTGVRLTLTSGEQFNILDNITNIFQIDSSGLNLFGNNLGMGTGGNIIAGGSGEGMTNIGHLDFIDNLATPAAAISLYSDGTDLFANTGGGVVNLSDIGGGGEVNTASNVGTGIGKVFKQKVVADLQFKSILEGSGIAIVNGTDDVQVNATSDGNQDATPFVDPTSGNPLVDEDVYMSNSKQGLEISNTTNAQEDVMVYVPIFLGRTTNIDRLAWVKADAVSVGNISWTIGIYDSVHSSPNVGANYPADLIVSGNTTSDSTEGIKFIGISPTTFPPGLYWLGFLITNISTASILVTSARHETANANCVGYFINTAANDRLDNILSYAEAETSIPSSAPAEMGIIGANPMALFYRVNTVF